MAHDSSAGVLRLNSNMLLPAWTRPASWSGCRRPAFRKVGLKERSRFHNSWYALSQATLVEEPEASIQANNALKEAGRLAVVD